MQKILLIGSGGREHAVGWKVTQSARKPELYFAPGNAGTAMLGTNVAIEATEIAKLIEFVKSEKIELTLALPDDPLALGIVDSFRREGLRIFGSTKNAAQLEASKAFAKHFMQTHGLPTAAFATFTDHEEAKRYIGTHALPVVVKASGLALGKGVIICQTKDEAIEALENILVKKIFGESGSEVVIEEFMTGPEISTHAFSDGITHKSFPVSQDHKRVGEGDTGPNTGGMGTISPLPFVDQTLLHTIEQKIITPTFEAMQKDGTPFEGVLYPGLMVTESGPKIIEYNVRFGDPEAQIYMRLLDTDILEIVDACIDQKLSSLDITWKDMAACNIVLASGGYPGSYEKGKIISGIEEAELDSRIKVFHAGTKRNEKGELVTNGGRVLGVSASAPTLEEALKIAYTAVSKISFEGMQYRKDIGKKALNQN